MSNRRFFVLLLVNNLLLTAFYFVEKGSIQCEPCPSDIICPPCQTHFMEYFLWYLSGSNLLLLIFRLIQLQRNG